MEYMMQDKISLAEKILFENTEVLYGIFGIINTSGYFPPYHFLNEFLLTGNDPCDQDGRMEGWIPFKLSYEEYLEVFSDWCHSYPNTTIDDLNAKSWNDWVQEILEL